MGSSRAGDAPLNLKQVAAALGVHYMTAYRYVRTGRIDAEQVGTAWVVEPDAVERFRRSSTSEGAADAADGEAASATTSGPSVPGSPRRRTDWSERLARALVVGDEPSAWRVVQQALTSGHSATDCYLDLLTGALHRISSPEAGAGSSQEYLATATASRLVARLGAQFRRPGRSRGTVVFGAPSGELHSLPIAIVADLVRLEGFTCLELGANVPPEVFADATRSAPRLVAVGIGVTTAANIDSVRAAIAGVRAEAPGVPVVLGGQAVRNPEVAALAGATHWAADGAEALEVFRGLRARRGSARSAGV